jgi:geranylgeranyl reductase family protein
MTQKFDVLIVGAGPAGCACAIQLAKALPQLQIALLEKGSFPRDKICGDALSPDVVNQINMLSPTLAVKLRENGHAVFIKGLKIVGRKGNVFSYLFRGQKNMEMYVSARINFDDLLFEHTKQFPNIFFRDNCKVHDIQIHADKVSITSDKDDFEGKIVIGADGAHSVVARKLGKIPMDKSYHIAALRVYYENVSGLDESLIELHYLKEVLPGYLWIFPLPNNSANVGLGMPSDMISDKKIHLKSLLADVLEKYPALKERFKHAKPLESVKGFGLPLGGKRNKISGEKFLLLGDAASLIDPFTGEGIGNAIRSGRIAAEHLAYCWAKNDFSAEINIGYDKEIYRRMLSEFKSNHVMRKLIMYFPLSIDIFVWVSSRMKGLANALMDFFLWIHKMVGKIL